jgi:ABC-2 type transport system ATP-binding protein
VSGPPERLAALAPRLHGRDGISHVTAFGNTLHVTGEDEGELERAIAPFREEQGLRWREASATLEDVFIHLMQSTREPAP